MHKGAPARVFAGQGLHARQLFGSQQCGRGTRVGSLSACQLSAVVQPPFWRALFVGTHFRVSCMCWAQTRLQVQVPQLMP